jgi:hypothetical protein
LPGFELPEAVQVFQQEYDNRSARVLEDLADRIDANAEVSSLSEASREPLEQMLQNSRVKEQGHLADAHVQSLITLLRGIDGLTTSLAEEIAIEFDRTGN